MRRLAFFAAAMLLGLSVSAQTFRGTMRVDRETFKDVSVKLDLQVDSVNATASVMIYRVLDDVVKPYKINLLIPDILLSVNSQRMSLVCHNVVPQCEGREVPEYIVRRLNGSVMADVFSFSCVIDEKHVTYSGVLDLLAR